MSRDQSHAKGQTAARGAGQKLASPIIAKSPNNMVQMASVKAPNMAPNAASTKISSLSVSNVKTMTTKSNQSNVEQAYSHVEKALQSHIDARKDRLIISNEQREALRIYMYSTIAAETGNFLPREETANKTNSLQIPYEYLSPNDMVDTKFSKYSNKNGNKSLKDAQDFRGRGYVQITGRGLYAEYGPKSGVHNLLQEPSKACDPEIAAKILVAYVLDDKRRDKIISSLNKGDMSTARKAVNGGTNGLKEFKKAYVNALESMDPTLKDRTLQAIQSSDNPITGTGGNIA